MIIYGYPYIIMVMGGAIGPLRSEREGGDDEHHDSCLAGRGDAQGLDEAPEPPVRPSGDPVTRVPRPCRATSSPLGEEHSMVSEAQKKARDRYRRKEATRVVRFSPRESDILEWLDGHENKAGYIKGLIRDDMERNGPAAR